jgi:hypothetical protein
MVNESFSGWGNIYLSRSHIKNMKKNMRKVPIIQTKSELYHMWEDKEAEKIISSIDNIAWNEEIVDIADKEEYNEKPKKWLWTRIKDLFKK